MITPARPTLYDGCWFRSRLEARWAVVFNTLGIRWSYEHEGFLVGNECYLPDFYLNGFGWVEIKPAVDGDNQKWLRWCQANMEDPTFRAYRITGDIPSPRDPDAASIIELFQGGITGGLDNEYMLCVCLGCGQIGIEWRGRGTRICKHPDYGHPNYSHDSARILTAYVAGRSMRFGEHY